MAEQSDGNNADSEATHEMADLSGSTPAPAAPERVPIVVDPVDTEMVEKEGVPEQPAQLNVEKPTASALVQVTRPLGSHISHSFFSQLSLLDICPDTLIPSYLVDPNILLYLARLPDSQPGRVVIGPAVPPGGVKLVPYVDSDEEEDFEIKEIQGPIVSATPKKRRARKMKEPLGRDFVRRSKRTNPEVGGFKDAASAQAAENYPVIYAKPLAVVPSSVQESVAVAPYLSVGNIQSIGVDFLQMQPSAISAAALLDLDDE
ncbi:unnamed protein product [Urochloa humidicola]